MNTKYLDDIIDTLEFYSRNGLLSLDAVERLNEFRDIKMAILETKKLKKQNAELNSLLGYAEKENAELLEALKETNACVGYAIGKIAFNEKRAMTLIESNNQLIQQAEGGEK